MPGLPITITDAGRAALIDAQNTGTVALTISQVGVSPTHTAGALTGLAALPGELKRLNTFAGDVVANDTLHLTIRDESADTFSLRAFALYLSNGVLFAVYSQAAPILEKSAAAMLLLSTDIILASLTTAMIEFGDTDFINPPATTDTPGVVELADQDETNAGVDLTKAVTPGRLKVLLNSLLGGKANAAHTHDAADVTSGVFSTLRIPDLALAKITGLVAALAGKSDTGHQHAAADITSGTFNVLRIPDLAISKITDLAVTLGGKAALVHTHVIADITGLAAALAGKSDTGHGHVMGEITGLVAALAGKAATAHSHVMADITGLAAAFALKADAAVTILQRHNYIGVDGPVFEDLAVPQHGFNWGGSAALNGPFMLFGTYGGGTPNMAIAGTYAGGSAFKMRVKNIDDGTWGPWRSLWHDGNFDPALKATLNTDATFRDLHAVRAGREGIIHLGDQSVGGRYLYANAAGNYEMPGGHLFLRGYQAWTSETFNPADKAPAVHSHDWAQVTGKPSLVSGAYLSDRPFSLDANTIGAGVDFHYWNGATANRPAGADGVMLTTAYSPTYGTQLATDWLTNDWFVRVQVAGAWAPWAKVWTTKDLDPTAATAAQFRANSSSQPLNPTGVWSAAALVAAAQAGTIAIDLSAGLNFTTTMTGNRTLGAPSNAKPGQSGVIQIIQDGTGNRTLAFDAAWKFEGGSDPVLSTAANARDVLVFTVIAAGDVVASLMKDVR